MLRSFGAIYRFISRAFIILFALIITAGFGLIVHFCLANPLWYIPFLIFGIIISILVGSYIDVVLSVPFELPAKFDPIRDKVAQGGYNSLQEFQREIANFMLDFFNFLGADIVGGKFHFKDCEPLLMECDLDFSQFNPDSFKKNKKRINANQIAFHLSVHLGNEKLGYMIIITSGYVLPIFYSILEDFVNHYLDDQIKHFLN